MINCIQTLKQHLMINCTPRKIPFILNLILLFEKQIIECNSVKHINEDSQTSLTNIKNVDQFWKTVKPLFSEKISHEDSISLTEDGKTITENLQIAEIFNKHFSNVIRSMCDRMSPQNQVLVALKMQFLQQSINSEIISASSLLIKAWG